MGNEVYSGAIAIVGGALLAVVLFVPFVAVSYRRRGRFGPGRTLVWAAALVYFLAIWTYTLLPLPDPDDIRCAGVNLDLWAFVDDIAGAIARPGNTLTDPAVLQLALNVLLFMPLGFFLRVLGGRGLPTALLVGLGTSVFIETTQLTGVWGVYPCAYRVFDVDDMATNTLGAVVGSVVALAVPRRHRGLAVDDRADAPRPVTRRRRLLGMACDALAIVLAQLAVAVGLQVAAVYLLGVDPARSGPVASTIALWSVCGVWLVVVLATGGTIGDLAVALRYRGGRLPRPVAGVLRYLAGVGGWMLLTALPGVWALSASLLAIASLLALLTPLRARGIPGLVSGQHLVDAREPEPAGDLAPR